MTYAAEEGEGLDTFRIFVINADGTGYESEVQVSVRRGPKAASRQHAEPTSKIRIRYIMELESWMRMGGGGSGQVPGDRRPAIPIPPGMPGPVRFGASRERVERTRGVTPLLRRRHPPSGRRSR